MIINNPLTKPFSVMRFAKGMVTTPENLKTEPPIRLVGTTV